MSYPVQVTVQAAGHTLADFQSLTITQELFTHHTFALAFSFEGLARALGISPDLVFKQAHEQLSGQPITISWVSALPGGPGGRFEFKGIILETSIQTNSDLTNYYHISGASPTYLLEDGSQSRSFVKQTVKQIFSAVLGEYAGNDFERQLNPRQLAVLPYVAQYDETNFNFLSRLAAQQGEWFYYDGTQLQLGLVMVPATVFESSGVQGFTLSLSLQPNGLKGGTYNYRTHQQLQATAVPPAGGDGFSRFAVRRSRETFAHPHRLLAEGTLTDAGKLQAAMDMLAAKQTSGLVTLEGDGEVFTLHPGSVLDVRDAAGTEYGEFRVLAVVHELDGDGNYRNRFKALPEALATPPPNELYAAPAAHPELAEVIDLADPRRLGRVRVRFQWLVERPAQAESGWLRVTAPYSGDGKGHLFTPELHSQVLVSYEHGVPERPVVVGNVFHALNKQGARYTNPDNNLKGLQTAGGNKFVLGDTPGQQHILLSNSNNKGTAIKVGFDGAGNVSITTGGPVSITGSSITLEAGEKGEIKMHAKNIVFEANDAIRFTSQKDVALNAKDLTLSVSNDMHAQIDTDLTIKAAGKAKMISSDTDII